MAVLVLSFSVFNHSSIQSSGLFVTAPYVAPLPPVEVRIPEPREYLMEKTGPDFDLFNRIVIAESGWQIDIKNASSSASGLFQFLDGTFKTYCIGGTDAKGNSYGYFLTDTMKDKNNPYIQIDCAVAMIYDGGLSHWNESKYLWDR